MSELQVRLEMFEGPVELLLYLVRKEELDIFDIPIARLTDDYLTLLRASENIDLTAASDFLIMAAVLVRLKVRALLPRQPEEDLSTPEISLEQILDAYRQFQVAARILSEKEAESRLRFPRTGESAPPVVAESEDIVLLTRAFTRLFSRITAAPPLKFEPQTIRLEDKIARLRHLLAEQEIIDFETAVAGATLTELIVTFFALLELVRLGEVKLEQPDAFAPIRLRRRTPSA